ncbi:MAG: CPBP family intramembrane metalloprotease [Clostridiales bacterium]|nr:CPBP family intramembrane metalloprotease [Clostridiales bacterium]
MKQTTRKRIGKKSFIVFFAIVILLSTVVETMICRGGSEWLYMVLMWIPAAAAVVANCISFRENKERFSLKKLFAKGGFRKCKLRYVLLGCLLPLLYLLIPYMVFWQIYPENFAYHGVSLAVILKDLLPILVVGIFISLLSALGEEIGWRGFMVPALYERVGLNKTLLISSLFWCCWHLPLLVGGGYMSGTPLWYQLPAFVLCIFPVGVMAGLLTIKSGSVWPAAFLHAAHNNYDQAVFDIITAGANKMYYVSETGVLTILCAWVLAAILYSWVKKEVRRL